MRIYTRTGDKGTTSLVYGKRVPKNHIRVETYGTCDEANSMIGLAVSHLVQEDWDTKQAFIEFMHRIQTILFYVGSEFATPPEKEVAWKLTETHIQELEQQIDQWDRELRELKHFILPAGHPAAAALHSARTIVRRAERTAVSLQDELNSNLPLSYLNRLSDLLFVAARYINKQTKTEELPLKVDK
ncbi:cob(I)yrinic acid a,c-diamide adenosyltransferase [Aquibacillus salsiterrae]|uniref:Corrinoid adenosyltransferase n=1 Tax=Aquibacillus salsiterrae TaxID=2950439 RepID=A0A9X3WGH9_9BACI|nr:cob(I)yrinic acid a,c-diamide adenosyltransferase [Aquibacillus salsiterrae]MDC3418218.1 cob(I)yrinic acid a,c-diamide adenosyltransferase [Aquibacillus salsiterrae]